ncbi:hypothetical protein NBE99_08675 [Thermosynechococcus sp. HN-54]|uniref:DUF6790 family protein n=1 Tax=Thermosynechococcus sp. HN-54 TaxID=2933959 RepID=UPI00202CF0FF|nr:DUF6790 family protein [Thermosynechococcus sp. HN-54]URR34714.1 hypothetical protein NBE99_08675 [Thermosynechococcus sp. HN-54]
MIWLFYGLMTILGIGLHLWRQPHQRTRTGIIHVSLLYLLVVFVGIGGMMGALVHTFDAEATARKIGWLPGSPFQFEVAMANLAFGILGLLCIWQRGLFWTATGIGFSVYVLGCAYGHYRQMLLGNFAPYNAGWGIWLYDVAVPLLILALLWGRSRWNGFYPPRNVSKS